MIISALLSFISLKIPILNSSIDHWNIAFRYIGVKIQLQKNSEQSPVEDYWF